jgi:ABC-type nitrate/sulfonate/bicarbonate transport system substrate-binding protein
LETHAVIAALLLAAAVALPAQKITLTLPSINMLEAPYIVAQQKGYFAAEGLDVDFLIANGGVATPALLSGSVIASASSASAVGAIMKGAPLRIVLVQQSRAIYQLWSTRPDVHSLADLKGKQIGIETRGDAGEISTRMAFAAAGMSPDAVGYVPLGTANAASGISGVLPAFVLGTSDVDQFKTVGGAEKAHLVMDYGLTIQMPMDGMAVAQKLIAERPGTLKKLLRAIVKGMLYTRAFKAQTIAMVVKVDPALDPRAESINYDQYVASLAPRLEVPNDVIRADLDVRASLLSMPRDAVPPIDAIYDFAPLRAAMADLNASGWKPTR